MTLRRLASPLLLSLAALTLAPVAPPAHAQVGLRSLSTSIADPAPFAAIDASTPTVTVPVVVWYPTAAAATPQSMGPFRFAAAIGAPPSPTPRGQTRTPGPSASTASHMRRG